MQRGATYLSPHPLRDPDVASRAHGDLAPQDAEGSRPGGGRRSVCTVVLSPVVAEGGRWGDSPARDLHATPPPVLAFGHSRVGCVICPVFCPVCSL